MKLKAVLSPEEVASLNDGREVSTEDILAAQMAARAGDVPLHHPVRHRRDRRHQVAGKLLESGTLRQQAANNTKEQFANSPDLKTELLNAIMGALDAHTAMSTQALNSPRVQSGLKDILLDHAGLWEALREQSGPSAAE